MSIDTRAYIFQMFTDIICWYTLFCTLNLPKLSVNKTLYGCMLIPIILIVYIYTDFSAFFVFSILLYFIFKSDILDLKLANLLLYCDLVFIPVSFLSSAGTTNFVHRSIQQGWKYVVSTLVVQIVLLAIVSKFTRNFINKIFSKKQYQMFLFIGQLLLLVIFYFYIQFAHEFGVFDKFIWGSLSFVVIEFLVLLGFFIFFYFQTKRKYESKLQQQQLSDLRRYTQQLEQSQLNLRKFRHDYKNMLLTLIGLAHNNDIKDINNYLNELHVYSTQKLKQDTDRYQDIKNVKEIHMKGILLSKFFTMEQKKLSFVFECRKPVEKVEINSIDIVRLLSILLDNAIEAVDGLEHREIQVAVLQGKDNLKIEINNSISKPKCEIPLDELAYPGFSTKNRHSGLGLSIINDIRQRNSNVFVKYECMQGKFEVEILILNTAGREK